MESSRNVILFNQYGTHIIKGGQNGVKSQLHANISLGCMYYKGGAKWSQVATILEVVIRLVEL